MRQRLLEDEERTVFRLALVLTMVLSATPAVITLAAILLAAPVPAEPTSWRRAGKENAGQTGASDDRGEDRKEHGRQFSDHDRFVVREYYQANFPTGTCALAPGKKNDGCVLPNQAKKWQIGHQLPTGLVYSEVPPPIIIQLPPPRTGLRYVRIGTDILLISVRTEVVVDAIQDLGRM